MMYGHKTKEWELGWSNPRQDYSMHHCIGDHRLHWVEHQEYVHPVFPELVWFIFCLGGHPCKGFAITFCDHSVGISGCSIEGLHPDFTEGPVSSCTLIHLGR